MPELSPRDVIEQSFREMPGIQGRMETMNKPCPNCHVPMVIEDGLWYCDGCDAYHGDAEP